jgi:hypothetical protein
VPLPRGASSYIEVPEPRLNPYLESFGSRSRDERRAVERFSCLAEAKVMACRQERGLQREPPPLIAADDGSGEVRPCMLVGARKGNVFTFTATAQALSVPEGGDR